MGKAKSLRSRIRSYFQRSAALDVRKTAMMKSVRDFEYTVTENELEALILEANLIKEYRPRFNVLLRDDKSYPYLRLTVNETWPRLEVVRRFRRDGARYFGPYVPSGPMWEILSFIRNTFRIPTCSYSLDRRRRPCIQHQIRKCVAPCTGEVDPGEYRAMIREVQLLLEGRNKGLLNELEEKMGRLSHEMRYEEAAMVRDRIRAVQKISEKQKVVAPELGDVDVIGLFRSSDAAVFKVLFFRNGMMIGARELRVRDIGGETDASLMADFIEQFYGREILPPPEILCSHAPEDREILTEWLSGRRGEKLVIAVPKRGNKKKLVTMAVENARLLAAASSGEGAEDILREVAERLGLPRMPRAIGAFDISNISGKEPVGAFVLWENGGFLKEKYRHIMMDEIPGPDDYAMMREMVKRTIANLGEDLPELIVIDGGREHLEAALTVFRQENLGRRQLIGLAKDPDRAFLPGGQEPVFLGDGSASSLLLRRIRDEAHRFAIAYHRKRRRQRAFESPLEKIPGVGRKRRLALLRHFGSIEAIRKASAAEIAALEGFTGTIADRIVSALREGAKRKGET